MLPVAMYSKEEAGYRVSLSVAMLKDEVFKELSYHLQ
jgi:hypothetical protein